MNGMPIAATTISCVSVQRLLTMDSPCETPRSGCRTVLRELVRVEEL